MSSDNGLKDEDDFRGGQRGKYFARYQRMKLKVMLDPDVARVFPDSDAVNTALRRLAGSNNRSGPHRQGNKVRRRKAG
ncbi:MAG: hypothetical protein IT437_07435 [Phycisphaerales bacterium]|nr:hypothetical protein [Phycisphaerales bacterium]